MSSGSRFYAFNTLLDSKTMVEHHLRYTPDANVVSNDHCQSGNERSYYSTYMPETQL